MPLPFSDLLAFRRDPLALFMGRARETEPGLAPLYLGPKPIWLVTDPALARDVLRWPTDELDKGRLVQTLQPLMGSSLLTNVGEAHARTKAAVHRHVQRNAALKYLPELMAVVNRFATRLAVEPKFDTHAECPPLALHLGCTALFGHEVISTADRLALIKAVQVVEGELAAAMFQLIPSLPWKAADRKRKLKHARDIVDVVVRNARNNRERSEIIGALEEAGLSDADINAEILGLFIAGHHTTGSSIAWILYHLASDPMIAEMIAIEADACLPALERTDATALRHAPLSQTFISEILRLYPAGWWTSRETKVELTLGGRKFKPGEMVIVAPWQLHRDERFWDEPNALRMDRDLHNPAYMPFGVGHRACIGMSIAQFELQLVTLQLASAFSFALEKPDAPVRPVPSVTMLAPPIQMRARARTETAFRRQVA